MKEPTMEEVKGEQVFDFIRENFGKVEGQLCSLDQWLHFFPDKVCYEYVCCELPDCFNGEYEEYFSVEALMNDWAHLKEINWSWREKSDE